MSDCKDWLSPYDRTAIEAGFYGYTVRAVAAKADKRIRELEAQLKAADELPLSEFGDVLGHNYWLDANTLQALWKRMREASMRALSRNEEQAKGGAHGE